MGRVCVCVCGGGCRVLGRGGGVREFKQISLAISQSKEYIKELESRFQSCVKNKITITNFHMII